MPLDDAIAARLARPIRIRAVEAVPVALPLGADEGIHSLADIDAHAAAGAGGLSLKLIKLGGPSATLRAASLAAHRGLSINVAAKVAESSLGSAATLHLATMVPSADWGVSLTQVYLAEDMARPPLKLVDGKVKPPPGPGLGVEVAEAAVRRFQA